MRNRNAVGLLCLALGLAACDKDKGQPTEAGGTSATAATGADAANAPAADPAPVAERKAAEDTSVAAVVEESKRSSEAMAEASPGDAMDQVSDALGGYLQQRGAPVDGGVANLDGKSVEFAVGMATSVVEPGAAAFSQARNLAFEKAFQAALGQLAQNRERRITTLVTSQAMQDTSSAADFAEACKPTADEALVMKMSQLVNAGMDAALRELEVPESDIAAQKPVFRCENPRFLDSISTMTRTTALASLRGVRIVKSLAIGPEVGVVVAVSPNFVTAAQALARGEASRNPLANAVSELNVQFAKAGDGQFLGEYGTRMAKLSNGEVAIFAFGQAASGVTANDQGVFRSGKRRAARSLATRNAESQLAQFAKVTTYFAAEATQFARASQILAVEDGVASEEQATEVGSKLVENIRSAAELRLQGAQVIRTWSSTDPDSGDLVEGVILAWSPSLAGAMQAANRPAAAPGARAGAAPAEASRVESAERQEDW